MHVELKTNDPALIARFVAEQVESGKTLRMSLDKSGEWHRLSVTEATDEATDEPST